MPSPGSTRRALTRGECSRYVGSFRPWCPRARAGSRAGTPAADVDELAAGFREPALDALAESRPLDAAARRPYSVR